MPSVLIIITNFPPVDAGGNKPRFHQITEMPLIREGNKITLVPPLLIMYLLSGHPLFGEVLNHN